MFKLLRSKAKIFYWVIAASFILFIFLAWGMDFTGRGRPQQDDGVVGYVAGVPITSYEYDSAVQNYLGRLRQQNPERELSPSQVARVREETWNALVQDRLEQKAIADLGLTVTPEEILYTLRNNPPPELLAGYTDENGQPDLQRYFADLTDPGRDWSGVEEYLRRTLPRQKLQQLITSGAVVTDAEIRRAWLQREGRAVVEYVGVPYDGIELESEPSDQEVAAWYDSHAGLYWQPERARVSVASWAKEPSERDEQEVRDLALEIKQAIVSGEMSFADAAAIYSEDATAENGGDLGTFGPTRMVKPFSDVAFSLPVGEVSDPVRTDFGYHLIEVLDRETEGDEVQRVHARHILLKVRPGPETTSRLLETAEQFRDRAEAGGFAAAAEAAGDSVQIIGPETVGAGQELPGLTGSLEGSYFALRSTAGDLSPVFENDDSFYLVAVDTLLPGGPAPLAEVRQRVVLGLQTDRKRQLAAERLEPAVGALQMSGDWAAVAQEHDLVHAVTDTIGASSNVPNVGFGTAFNMVALEAGKDQLVPRVETPQGLFALRAIWQKPLDEEAMAEQAPMLRARLLAAKQQDLLRTWYEEQTEQAKIVDQRDERRRPT